MIHTGGLAVLETHPIQYHAPVYRVLQAQFGVPVTAIYGSDFSIAGYRDEEFGATFAWDTDLMTGYQSVFLAKVAEPAGVPVHQLSRRMNRALRAVRPGAVLLVGYRPRFHQLAFLNALATRAPVLFRGETTDHARRRGAIKAFARDWALRRLYQHCARLLYVGKRSLAHFRRLGCAGDRLIFSPYCVDAASFAVDERARAQQRPETRQALHIRDDALVFLFSGKLSHRKGPDLLLSALKQLPPHLRNRAVAVFVGSGEMQGALHDLAASAPAIEARFLGFQNQSQLSAAYHAADMLVLPSRSSETWGLVVNEALHHGLPAVVSDAVGCAPDLIVADRTGAVAETNSVESLALAVERTVPLVRNQDVREACQRRVASFSVEAAARGIAEAYFAVAAQQSRPPSRIEPAE